MTAACPAAYILLVPLTGSKVRELLANAQAAPNSQARKCTCLLSWFAQGGARERHCLQVLSLLVSIYMCVCKHCNSRSKWTSPGELLGSPNQWARPPDSRVLQQACA